LPNYIKIEYGNVLAMSIYSQRDVF